jgi:hypothetical protein
MTGVENRKHPRFPVIYDVGQPVIISLDTTEIVPGVIIDLSASGMALLSYVNIEVGTDLKFAIDITGLQTATITGKIVRSFAKGEMFLLAISFTGITSKDFDVINKMAYEFTDCEKKIALGVKDVCFLECTYHPLCYKPQKIKKQ